MKVIKQVYIVADVFFKKMGDFEEKNSRMAMVYYSYSKLSALGFQGAVLSSEKKEFV